MEKNNYPEAWDAAAAILAGRPLLPVRIGPLHAALRLPLIALVWNPWIGRLVDFE